MTSRAHTIWLITLSIAIIMMVFIGGLTRLTNSGLSMTQWKPVTGILPPTTVQDWQQEFIKYKNSPEYRKYNSTMTLAEFKPIYLLEFYHRLAGRLVALLYLLPLLFFLLTKQITYRQSMPYISGFLLLISQGIMGWYMVKSGLTEQAHVSHFRLAAHLILAILLFIIIFWQLLKKLSTPILLVSGQSVSRERKLNLIVILTLLIQMILGAFVAGLDAGLIYNNFPLMGEYIIPPELYIDKKFSLDFYQPATIQFLHRIGAYVTFGLALIFCYSAIKLKHHKLNKATLLIFCSLILQMALGILTIIYIVPIPLALLHQLGAILLLSSLIWSYFLLSEPW